MKNRKCREARRHQREMISSAQGFTLLEILIALFIFTLLSMILANALRNVVDALGGTENKAERLRQLQLTMLVMSRDIEQTVNRPVINASGKQDPAFRGSAHGFIFTQAGLANPAQDVARSNLQRTGYQWSSGKLLRLTWSVLDQPPKSQPPHAKVLLGEVTEAHFEYLDKKGETYNDWPLNGQGGEALPRSIRVYLTLTKWGMMTQLYLIPAQVSKNAQQSAVTSPGSQSSTSQGSTPTQGSPNTMPQDAAAKEKQRE